MMLRRECRAMGTDVLVLLDAEDDVAGQHALDEAEAEIHRIERLATRFDASSPLMQLNQAGEGIVATDLLRIIRRARQLRAVTGGRFDPTVAGAIRAAGYDRTFSDIAPDGPPGVPVPGGGVLEIDEARGWVHAPVGLDLGAIAKGWTADHVADALGALGPCLVSIGGDLAVRGSYGGEPWPIAVDYGAGSRTVGLRRGGMATSGTDRRRWRRDGATMHHVIDPVTGCPSDTDLRRVTVIAADAAAAEAWATALLVAGRDEGRRLAAEQNLTAVLVGSDDAVIATGDLG